MFSYFVGPTSLSIDVQRARKKLDSIPELSADEKDFLKNIEFYRLIQLNETGKNFGVLLNKTRTTLGLRLEQAGDIFVELMTSQNEGVRQYMNADDNRKNMIETLKKLIAEYKNANSYQSSASRVASSISSSLYDVASSLGSRAVSAVPNVKSYATGAFDRFYNPKLQDNLPDDDILPEERAASSAASSAASIAASGTASSAGQQMETFYNGNEIINDTEDLSLMRYQCLIYPHDIRIPRYNILFYCYDDRIQRNIANFLMNLKLTDVPKINRNVQDEFGDINVELRSICEFNNNEKNYYEALLEYEHNGTPKFNDSRYAEYNYDEKTETYGNNGENAEKKMRKFNIYRHELFIILCKTINYREGPHIKYLTRGDVVEFIKKCESLCREKSTTNSGRNAAWGGKSRKSKKHTKKSRKSKKSRKNKKSRKSRKSNKSKKRK